MPPDSQTETFAALRLFVDNWRWQDVPFYLRTGKRLPRQVFRNRHPVPRRAAPVVSRRGDARLAASRLVMSIQPDEGIVLRFQAKYPGRRCCCGRWTCASTIARAFATPSPEAYETLLWDIINNDATLFMRADQVEAAWRLLMPVLDVWKAIPPAIFPITPAARGGRTPPRVCWRTRATGGRCRWNWAAIRLARPPAGYQVGVTADPYFCARDWAVGSCEASQPPPRASISSTLAVMRRVCTSMAERWSCKAMVCAVITCR